MRTRLSVLKSTVSTAARRPVVVLIPGGPGLSSRTLRSMELLVRSLDVAFVDPPGTGGAPEELSATFESLVADMTETLAVRPEFQGRSLFLVGHSYGGIQAAEIAIRAERGELGTRRLGVLFLGTPLSDESYEEVLLAYSRNQTPALREAEKRFEAKPSRETFLEWLASYERLYFREERIVEGAEMLRADPASVDVFLRVSGTRRPRPEFVDQISALKIPKYLVGGGEDLLVPPSALRMDSERTGLEFCVVPRAGHFMTFDQPGAVAALIEKAVSDSECRGML